MNPGELYLLDLVGNQRLIAERLHGLLADDLGLECKIRYKIPFYFLHSWICYLNPIKKVGIELAFTRGNELSNDQGVLEAKDRKQIKGISYFQIEEIDFDILMEVLQEAILLDETIPYAAKRKKNNKS